MAKKTEEKKDVNEEKKDSFKTWADNYTAVLKMGEDSYLKLYKPWIESTGEMFGKAAELSTDDAPEKYKEFYDEWVKIYQNNFGQFYPVPTLESNKKTLEKFLSSAEESNKLYMSWISQLKENSRKTKEILQDKPDPAKYKECHEMWMKSYEKIFDELMELPAKESTKEIFGNFMGIPDIYSGSFMKFSKLWTKSYTQLLEPLNQSMLKLSGKMAEISRGDAGPEAYKEFYILWMDTNKVEHSGEMFEHFVKSSDIYLSMYKSGIAALEKMSEKAEEISGQSSDPKAYKEFYKLWVTTYEKAFDGFFDDIPAVVGPMKEVMEPAKIIAKMYADTYNQMSKMWRSDFSSASMYPGKNNQ